MSHATPAEIHDHVYGFRSSAHVPGCEDCRRVAETLSAERDAIRGALSEESPEPPRELLAALTAAPRRRPDWRQPLPLAALATAAALLAGLVWLLLHEPPLPETPAADGSRLKSDPVDRLIEHLKSPSAVRRELAALALARHGALALERLERAKADPAVIDACRGITPQDRALIDKFKSIRLTIDMENAPLTAVVDYVREISGLNFVIDGAAVPDPDQKIVSVKLTDVSLEAGVRLMLEPGQLTYHVKSGVIVLTAPSRVPPPPSFAPVRIGPAPRDAALLVDALGSDSPDDRDRATAALRSAGFAAESALWDGLGSKNAETRARSADLLRTLYGDGPKPEPTPLEKKLAAMSIDLAFENSKALDIVDFVADFTQAPFFVAADDSLLDKPVTFKVKALSVQNTLRLLFSQYRLEYRVVDEVVLVDEPGMRLVSSAGDAPVWAEPAEARRLESLVRDVAAGGRAAAGRDAVPVLLRAARTLEGEAAARCRAAARKAAEEERLWLLDEPSGAELQRLSPEQKAVLAKKMSFTIKQDPVESLKKEGVACVLRAPLDTNRQFYVRGVPTITFLKALTRPRGLDFFMEGTTVVIDTPSNVQAAVEKK